MYIYKASPFGKSLLHTPKWWYTRLVDTNITITCNKCARHFVINTEDFDVKIIGALQVRCKNCHQVKTLPDNDQIWGLKQGEETENQIARLL